MDTYTPAKVAKMLDTSPNTVRRYADRVPMPDYQPGKDKVRRFTAADVVALAQAMEKPIPSVVEPSQPSQDAPQAITAPSANLANVDRILATLEAHAALLETNQPPAHDLARFAHAVETQAAATDRQTAVHRWIAVGILILVAGLAR